MIVTCSKCGRVYDYQGRDIIDGLKITDQDGSETGFRYVCEQCCTRIFQDVMGGTHA